jgi:hypothetical protein
MPSTIPNIIIKNPAGEVAMPWLREGYLLELLPLLSKTYLDVKARPQYKAGVSRCFQSKAFLPCTGKSWRWAKVNGTFYYCYDNIPDKAPNNYRSALPSRIELVELAKKAPQQSAENSLEIFLNPFLNDYKQYLQSYGDCTKQQQVNLAQAASFIEGCCHYFTSNRIEKKDGKFFKAIAAIATARDLKYIPHHYRNLQQLICNSIIGSNQPITSVIKLPRSGNQNAAVFCNDEQIESWIINLRNMGQNFTAEHIIRKIKFMCTVFEKPLPSRRWIGTKMDEANIKFITAGGRFGAKGKHGQPYRAYTPFANALYAGDCWQVDGTRVNMVSFKQKVTITDEETGKTRTVNRDTYLTIVAVRDVHSGDCLGYCYNLSENRWAYIEALKMAVEEAGYLPYEIVFDKFPGHNSHEFESFVADLENRGVKVTFTHLAEGKAKLERWFGTLQTVFMQESDYYYGEGIQSKRKSAHRSKEYLAELRKKANKEGWNYDAAADECSRIIEAYRNTKYSFYSRKFASVNETPAQIHTASEKPNVKLIEPQQYAYLFGLKRKAKIANMGLIDFEVNTAMFNYRLNNFEAIANNEYVLISYLLEDMSKIEVYELSDKPVKKHLGTAHQIADINPYGKNAFENYGQDKAIIKELSNYRNQMLEYKKAVGFDDMTILQAGGVKKYALEVAEDEATKQLIEGNTTVDFDYDITSQY